MRRVLTNTSLLLAMAVTSAAVGLAVSIWQQNFECLSRSGSVITFIGILLFNRHVILRKNLLLDVKMETGLSSLDPKHYQRVGEPVPPAVLADQKSRRAIRLAICTTFAGTLIWGFGDLFNKIH
jgi:hypothetical protein